MAADDIKDDDKENVKEESVNKATSTNKRERDDDGNDPDDDVPAGDGGDSGETIPTMSSVIQLFVDHMRSLGALPWEMESLGPRVTSTKRFNHDLFHAKKGPENNMSQVTPRISFEPKKKEAKKIKGPTQIHFTTDEEAEKEDVPDEHAAKRPRFSLAEQFAGQNKCKWQCAVCKVYTDNSKFQCASCETALPGHEGKQGGGTSATGTSTAGSIGTGGFQFGAPSAPGVASATGSTIIGSGGFTFGAPSAPAASTHGVASATGSTIGSGGFTFGAPIAAASTHGVASAAGGSTTAVSPFTFGAPSAPAASTPGGGFTFTAGNTDDSASSDDE